MAVTALRITALLTLSLLWLADGVAAEVDFSCMSMEVKGKRPLTDRYKEYDVMLQNRCPGPVYWTMCIERIDPVSHRIIETLNPSGVLEQEKDSRVNLQMKVAPPSAALRINAEAASMFSITSSDARICTQAT